MRGNPRDGYVDRLLLRRLSGPLTDRLVHTSLSPNAVTLLGLIAGTAGGLALALPWPAGAWLGMALLLASGVLDCCDGELARRRHAASRMGHLFDVVSDTLVHLSLFAGIVLALRRDGVAVDTRILLLLGTGALGALLAISWSERTEARRRRVACWQNRLLDGVLSPLTTRDWYVFPLAFALAGRLDALLLGAAVGSQVFWLVVAGLVAGALRAPPPGGPREPVQVRESIAKGVE